VNAGLWLRLKSASVTRECLANVLAVKQATIFTGIALNMDGHYLIEERRVEELELKPHNINRILTANSELRRKQVKLSLLRCVKLTSLIIIVSK